MEMQGLPKHRRVEQEEQKKRGIVGVAVLGVLALVGVAVWFVFGADKNTALKPDVLTGEEIRLRQEAFEQSAAIQLEPVKKTDLFKAFTSMKLRQRDVQKLEADMQDGSVWLAWITVWDDVAEDGDVIKIDAGGFTRVVALSGAKQSIAIPVNHGSVAIVGIEDGGGGITTAISSNGSILRVPVIAEGQRVVIPTAG